MKTVTILLTLVVVSNLVYILLLYRTEKQHHKELEQEQITRTVYCDFCKKEIEIPCQWKKTTLVWNMRNWQMIKGMAKCPNCIAKEEAEDVKSLNT